MCEFLDSKAEKQRYETQHNQKQQPHTAARTQQHILPAPTRIPQCRLRALPQGNRRKVHLRMSRAQMNVTAFRKPYTMPSRSSVNWRSWTELTSYILCPRYRAIGPILTQCRRIKTARTGIRQHTKDSAVTLVLTCSGGSRQPTAQSTKGDGERQCARHATTEPCYIISVNKCK
jgi:hypothetical protein